MQTTDAPRAKKVCTGLFGSFQQLQQQRRVRSIICRALLTYQQLYRTLPMLRSQWQGHQRSSSPDRQKASNCNPRQYTLWRVYINADSTLVLVVIKQADLKRLGLSLGQHGLVHGPIMEEPVYMLGLFSPSCHTRRDSLPALH